MQSKLAAENHRLEEVQQRRRHDKEKLQMQGEKLSRWQGEVRRLNNLVLHNNIKSGKFFEVRLPFPRPFCRCQSTFSFLGLMSGLDGICVLHYQHYKMWACKACESSWLTVLVLCVAGHAWLDMRGKFALADLNVIGVCVA